MLDPNLIKFVEPIGPGQIVDRASLVAVPVGYVQVAIENNGTEVFVKIFGLRGINSGDAVTNSLIKTYVWQNGLVVTGEEIFDGPDVNHNRRLTKMSSVKRRRSVESTFRFRKQPSHNPDSTVDGILQICIFEVSSGKIHRKSFVGTVHIALKCLTQMNDCFRPKEEWYKIFPKSAFLPGSPSDIAKTDCYISGQEIEEESDEIFLDGEDDPEEKSECSVSSSASVVSFSQFRLQHTRRPSIFTSPGTLMRRRSVSFRDRRDASGIKRSILTKWLRSQKSFDDEKTNCPKASRLVVDVESPTFSASAPPATCPFLVGSPSIASDGSFRSLTGLSSDQDRASCSTVSSSTDVGYESSRSGSSTSDDQNDDKKQRKSKFRLGFAKNWSFRGYSRSKSTTSAPISIPRATEGGSAREIPSKSRVLCRSYRIPGTKTFTSLSEIGKKDLSALPERSAVH